jgi:hypothetical protein
LAQRVLIAVLDLLLQQPQLQCVHCVHWDNFSLQQSQQSVTAVLLGNTPM